MSYAQEMIDRVTARMPGVDPELARLYALLALTRGEETSWKDVHDAWSVWCSTVRPDHWSLVPFHRLSEEKQELDRSWTEGVRDAAREADHAASTR